VTASRPGTSNAPALTESRVPIAKPIGESLAPTPKAKPKPVSGYKPGQWRSITLKDEIDDLAKQLDEAASPEKRKAQTEKLGPDWASQVANMLLQGVDDKGDVRYQNDTHRVYFSGSLTRAEQKRFLEHVDFLQTNFPVGRGVNMHISVGPSSQFGKGVGGETTLGTGSMFINEDVVKRDKWPAGMPASKNVDAALYVLAHEWGHSVSTPDEAREKHVHNQAVIAGGMSRYGTYGVTGVRNPAEGFAEAFAEWALTKGKTTNPATLEYAKHFGWRNRFAAN
jgi:hypothetical protein